MPRINITSVYVDDQDKALRFYTDILGFVKKTGSVTTAVLDDTCGNLIQIAAAT